MSRPTTDWRHGFSRTVGGRVLLDEPLARHTTFGLGGACSLLAWVEDVPTLVEARRYLDSQGVASRILGNGSNILVSDRGLAGAVLKLAGEMAAIRLLDAGRRFVEVEVGCGCQLGRMLAWARRNNAGGLEGLLGIPGTVGGALKVNAGTRMGSLSDRLIEARLLRRGAPGWVARASLGMGYRRSAIGPRTVALAVRFRLIRRSREAIDGACRRAQRMRAGQPRGGRSAGCFFRNTEAGPAGLLIERAGCKGQSLGGARVSDRHANYIVHDGDATARDVWLLSRRVARAVSWKFGVRLQREVELWGSFAGRSR